MTLTPKRLKLTIGIITGVIALWLLDLKAMTSPGFKAEGVAPGRVETVVIQDLTCPGEVVSEFFKAVHFPLNADPKRMNP